MDLTASFLAGSLLTLLLPLGLAAAVFVWWGLALRRRSRS